MNHITIIEKLARLLMELKRIPEVSPLIYADIEDFLAALKRDYSVKSVEPSQKTRLRAIHRFAKECVSDGNQPAYRGAFIAPDTGHISLTNGYLLWASPIHVDALPMVETEVDKLIHVKPLINQSQAMASFQLPSVQQLKCEYDLAKAESPKRGKHFLHTTKLDSGVTVNTRFLIHCMEMLGDVTTYHHGAKMSPLYMQATDGAYCLLIPIREQE